METKRRPSAVDFEHAPLGVTETTIGNVLTRTTGYLQSVSSHSLQPYRGCTFGRALCGVGCYVQHSLHILKGRPWGGFLEVRTNAAESYRAHVERESRWAAKRGKAFSIFMSSATDPFVPQEQQYGISKSVFEAMCDKPPEQLIVQTHSHRVAGYAGLLRRLSGRCDLRVHVSIETDRERLPGLPPHASSVQKRLAACGELRAAGVRTVVTVSPLLPIDEPTRFFARIAEAADAVVIDHFIHGDGSADGSRTMGTALPTAMQAVSPASVSLEYRDRMVEMATRAMPHRVGVSIDGFAGRYL